MAQWRGASGHVDVERAGEIAVVRLNRPDKLNALTIPMLADVGEALRSFGTNHQSRGLLLTGNGRAFSAGDDLPATESLRQSQFEELLEHFQELTRAVLASDVPVVAAVNGIAVGGAAELTLACDARIGHPGSDYLFPENEVGLTISNASTYLLPRLIGSRALPLVLDAHRISGRQAHSIGLIDYLVDSPDDVLPRALEVLNRWLERGLATPFHLRLLRPPIEKIEAAIANEGEVARDAWASGTPVEGIRRFITERGARRDS